MVSRAQDAGEFTLSGNGFFAHEEIFARFNDTVVATCSYVMANSVKCTLAGKQQPGTATTVLLFNGNTSRQALMR